MLALASAVLAAAAFVAAGPKAHAASKAVLPVTPNSFVGVVSDETFAALGSGGSSYIDSIRGAGVGLLRQKFDWDFLTFGHGAYNINWNYLDNFMRAMAQEGITVMPVLLNPPASITTAPATGAVRGNYPPRDLGAIGDFGAMLASHYGTTGSFWAENPQLPRHPITAWQIWNEPNLPIYWQPRPSATGYVQMLRLASQKIKAIDPNAEIITAGIPDSHIKGSIPLNKYVKQMYRAHAAGAFDTLAVNGYAPTGKAVEKLMVRIRKLVNKFGGRKTSLRISEFGWADRGPERPKGRFTVGKKQGPYTYQAIRALWKARKKLKLRGIVYYDWRDQPVYAGGKNFWGLHTGLLTMNGQPKPALAWFKRAVRSLH